MPGSTVISPAEERDGGGGDVQDRADQEAAIAGDVVLLSAKSERTAAPEARLKERRCNRLARLLHDSLPDQRALNDGRVELRGIDPQ